MKFESSGYSESSLLGSSFRTTADAPSSLSEATTTISDLTSSSSNLSQSFTKPKAEEVKVKSGKKSKGYIYRIREHGGVGYAVKFGGKLSETLKGKLSLGAEIIRRGGRQNIFRDVFGVGEGEGERLLKASQCYLSTTAGPIAGILFVSTHKVAFWSERPLTITSTAAPFLITTPYKVPETNLNGELTP